MATINGKSMRFIINVPIATGRRIIRDAKASGMKEPAFTSAGLVLGTRSMAASEKLMKGLKPEQLLEFLKTTGVAMGVKEGQKDLE